uniref:AAA+ ATPase domain-containing protein n=1 Tax=Rhizophagus irregularis (strain DAOM 181602 / DAOM 197198 / MUCL 43194) TaxID=747089 RepID=U9U2T1_RHIID
MSADTLFLKLECLARKTTQKLDLPEYALSVENLIKMALILLRARANIPVIVCGETGCGKTSLIVYLALMVEVKFQALNLHAGIDEETIMMFMKDALEKAERGEIWLLFDEINTSNYIGLLADLISHRMLNGKPIHPNIRLFAAYNPYRLRTKAQSQAGLTNRVKKFEEQSKLVYRVKPLPDQILDYVWDYGILKSEDEYRYILIMVEKELKTLSHPVFAELLFASQEFIRKVEERYSVSLRDVKRAIILVKFFHNSLQNRPVWRKGHTYPPPGNPTIKTRSYVLALSLCYHSRLYEQDLRKQYCQEMEQILHKHDVYIGENMFAKIIREEQEDYINRMQCPPNTAYNVALLENVLVMIVCILTKIPLFLIGASGSSKSLAIHLISLNLRGSDSNDGYFRKLPQVYLIPHQGSSSSTSEGIIKVFDKANKFQEITSKQFPVAGVVLLNEVGLDETSPFNPLSVLHYLLEPSYPATGPTVSVIGISNWRLDNSKSSRALLVQRPQFNLNDLVDTAERLLNERAIASGHKGALKPLAKAYSNFEKHGQSSSNFHGLRDYYALVKRLSLNEMTSENIQMALARNFGGTDNHVKLCDQYFGNVLKMFNSHKPWTYKQIQIEQLIDSNLKDTDSRHLMVIGKSDSIVNLLTYQLRRRDLDPVVILGSQFPDDQEDYYYSVLRRIMMCVEAGRPLILTDLEIIYGNYFIYYHRYNNQVN